jgi:hypothetical protein
MALAHYPLHHLVSPIALPSPQAVQRAQLVGWCILQQQQQRQLTALKQQQQLQVLLPDSFPEQCAWLMDKVLLQHLDVCFGQAMSVVVACVVYVAAKLLQANVTFKMVTEVSRLCYNATVLDGKVQQRISVVCCDSTALCAAASVMDNICSCQQS